MTQHEPKPCPFCTKVFVPRPQVGARQIACENRNCRRQRINRTKRLWYEKNPTCNYGYVKKFRDTHPDCQKQWRQKKKQRSSEHTSPPAFEDKLGSPLSFKTGPAESGGQIFSGANEIRNQLNITKTIAQLDLFRTGEIRNQLNLCITLPLGEILSACTEAQTSEIRNQSSA
jgi:hypothetical protein